MTLLAIGLAVCSLFLFSFIVLGSTLPQPRTNKNADKKAPMTNNNHTKKNRGGHRGLCCPYAPLGHAYLLRRFFNLGFSVVPCNKSEIGRVVHQMVEKMREYFLGSGDIIQFRMWTAWVPNCMQGLSHSDTTPLPATATDFLAACTNSPVRATTKTPAPDWPL